MRRIAALSRDARSAEGPLRSGSLIVPLPPRGETSGGGSAGLPGTEKIAPFGKREKLACHDHDMRVFHNVTTQARQTA